ncbi:MAG: hypothetical protein ACLT8E_03740 [Akkermansia sp.]
MTRGPAPSPITGTAEAYPQHENLPRLLHRSGGGRKPGQVLSAGERALIACGSGGLLVTNVQLEGSPRMNISQLIAGHPGERHPF